MNAQETINDFLQLKNKAISIANQYTEKARVVADRLEHNYPKKERAEIYYFFDLNPYDNDSFKDIEEVTEEHIQCYFDYNSACNCHPEYNKHYFNVPVAWLDKSGDELDTTLVIYLNEKEEKLRLRFIKEAECKKAEAKKKKEAQYESDMRTYLKLKERFGEK
jgi:hypothetical protein